MRQVLADFPTMIAKVLITLNRLLQQLEVVEPATVLQMLLALIFLTIKYMKCLFV